MELDGTAFLNITGPFDSDEDNADKVAYVHDAVKANAQEDKVAFVTETTASTDVTTTQVDTLPQTLQGEVSNLVSLAAPKAEPPGPDHTMTGSLWSKTSGGAVANQHPETFCVQDYSNFMLQEAWDNGTIVGKENTRPSPLVPVIQRECCSNRCIRRQFRQPQSIQLQ